MDKHEYPNDIDDYQKLRVIGKGSYGLVYEAIILKGKHQGEHICIKQITNLQQLDEKRLKYLKVNLHI